MIWCHLGDVEPQQCHLDHPFVTMNTIRVDVPLLEEDVFHDVRMLNSVCGNTIALENAMQAIA